jgi:hypothetical protein
MVPDIRRRALVFTMPLPAWRRSSDPPCFSVPTSKPMDLDGRLRDQANVHALLAKSISLAAELRRALTVPLGRPISSSPPDVERSLLVCRLAPDRQEGPSSLAGPDRVLEAIFVGLGASYNAEPTVRTAHKRHELPALASLRRAPSTALLIACWAAVKRSCPLPNSFSLMRPWTQRGAIASAAFSFTSSPSHAVAR